MFIEFKTPDELNTPAKINKAIHQEISVAREIGSKIYVVSDGDKYIWLNSFTGNRIVDENDNPVARKIDPASNVPFEMNNGKLVPGVELFGFEKQMSGQDDITTILAKANMLKLYYD